MKAPQPIPYQGSKRKLASDILKLFPNEISTLYEPFAGSIAVTIAAALNKKCSKFYINDINAPLMELWKEIINNPDNIVEKYSILWNNQIGREKEFYFETREKFNKSKEPDLLLYLIIRCAKNAVRYNETRDFNQSADNRRKGKKADKLRKEVNLVSSLLKNKIQISSMDYREMLDLFTKHDLIYLDPPYQGTSNSSNPRYLEGIDRNEFIEFLNELNKREISYILSYDGKTGDKSYGDKLPKELNLTNIEVNVGRSAQATLVGKDENTIEYIYTSPALKKRLNSK